MKYTAIFKFLIIRGIIMPQPIIFTNEDILTQVKLSTKMPEIIEKLIRRQIIQQEVKNKGIEIEKELLQETADQFRFINQLEDTNSTWQWLDKHCLSVDDFQQMIAIHLLIDKLIQNEFLPKVETYFLENQLDYTDVVMYEVILDDEALAWELFSNIETGKTSFYDVAHKYIRNTELRRKGGYLGIVNRRNLTPEISAAVFAAKPPQVLKPIISSRGIHLILVEEIIHPQLDEGLRMKIASEFFTEWLNKKAQIFDFQVQIS